MLCLITLCLMISAAGAGASDAVDTSVVTPYLGLAVPYLLPDQDTLISLEKNAPPQNRSVIAWLEIDANGKVKYVSGAADSAAFISAIEKPLKKYRFAFLDGRPLSPPMVVPVRAIFMDKPGFGRAVKPIFPINDRLVTDSTLLRLFFERNHVHAPTISYVTSLFYMVDSTKGIVPPVRTITARVFLNDRGELTDITYPVADQNDMSHAVHMALMNARYSPAELNGQAFAADFLITFRIFDNIKYPFTPLAPADSTVCRPMTADYVAAIYYNVNDFYRRPPLPRKHPCGLIHSAPLASRHMGTARLQISIDTLGTIDRLSVLGASPGLSDVIPDLIDLLTWYSACDMTGKKVPFRGKLDLVFNGSTKVVYIPEWLTP